MAERVSRAGNRLGLNVAVQSIANPRRELEDHYYNAQHSGLIELGLTPHLMTEDVLVGMLERIIANKSRIEMKKIMPRVRWA